MLLNFIRDSSYTLYKIGAYWLEIIEKLRKSQLLNDLKKDIKDCTLIGEHLGCDNLIIYPRNAIMFHSIVEHNSSGICKNPLESMKTFKKYNLYTIKIENITKNIKSYDQFSSAMINVFHSVASNNLSVHESGAVKYIFTILFYR